LSTPILAAGLIAGLALTVVAPTGAWAAETASPPSTTNAAPSATEDETATPVETTTSLTFDEPTIRVGESVAGRIQVSGDNPTGYVTIREGGEVLAQRDLVDGAADIVVGGLALGSHDLVASYTGDDANAASDSQSVAVSVEKWEPVVTLTMPGSVETGAQVSVTVSVRADTRNGTGEIVLERNGVQIASGVLGAGQVSLSFAAGDVDTAGSVITATFAGDESMTAAKAQSRLKVVPRASTTSVTITPGTSVRAGTGLKATVTVKAANGPAASGTVSLSGAVTRTASLSGGKAVIDLGTLPVGSHTVRASYSGDATTTGSWTQVGIAVSRLNATMTVSTTAVTYGTSVRIPVTVSGPPLAAGGTVAAQLDGVVVAKATLSGGRATLVLPASWSPGTRRVVVRFDGGASHALVSKALSVTITKARSSATASIARVAYGSTAKATVTVRGAGSTPAGTVKIYRGSTVLAAGNLSKGTVAISLPRMNPGSYALTVKYLGSSRHLPVASRVTLVVSKARPTVAASISGSMTPSGTHRISISVKKSSPAPSGKVTVYRGSKAVGSAKLGRSGTATITLPKLGVGGYGFKVSYPGDVRYSGASTSASVRITKARTFGDGMFRVGVDIPAGLYRVKVPAGSLCYWARLTDASGSFSSIIANQLEEGYGLVRVLSTDRYIESSRCGTWKLVSATSNWPFRGRDFPGDGVFLVNKDISPGQYMQVRSGCYIELLSDATGTFADIIDNDYSSGSTYLNLSKYTFAVRTSNCSTWYRY
jgi:hypothetical protein